MAFASYKATIEAGDTVVVFTGAEDAVALRVQPGAVFHNRWGRFAHDAMLGRPYGAVVRSNDGRGFLHALHPTPELWTLALPHRTQILYVCDVSLIELGLDLRPGSVVLEAGTGSGSLSHALARTLAPSGRLHTYEYHAERARRAEEEFEAHGLGNIVTVHQRDVCRDGFGADVAAADAVFLDLPKPWEALAHVAAVLAAGGRVCSFSPCIEQAQRACATMRDLGMAEVWTVECLLRPFAVRRVDIPDHTAQLQTRLPRRVDDAPGRPPYELDRLRPAPSSLLTTKPFEEMRGHTGFLTFCTRYT